MTPDAFGACMDAGEARLIGARSEISVGLPRLAFDGVADPTGRELALRIRASFGALGLSLPSRRVTVRYTGASAAAPEELALPAALSLLSALDIIPSGETHHHIAFGDLSRDGTILPLAGTLPVALLCASEPRGLICAAACGPEAMLVDDLEVIAASDLLDLVNHYRGRSVLPPPSAPPRPGTMASKAITHEGKKATLLSCQYEGCSPSFVRTTLDTLDQRLVYQSRVVPSVV